MTPYAKNGDDRSSLRNTAILVQYCASRGRFTLCSRFGRQRRRGGTWWSRCRDGISPPGRQRRFTRLKRARTARDTCRWVARLGQESKPDSEGCHSTGVCTVVCIMQTGRTQTTSTSTTTWGENERNKKLQRVCVGIFPASTPPTQSRAQKEDALDWAQWQWTPQAQAGSHWLGT